MSQAEFTAEETTDILRYLGYADWDSLASSIHLGFPTGTHHQFVARDSLQRIVPTARVNVRRDLCELRSIDAQLSQARERFSVSKVESVTMNASETSMLRQEYAYWQKRLADDLGTWTNPHSQLAGGVAGGMNAKVVG